MFKKTNIILTTVIGILLLSACGGETGESTTENNDNNSKKENQQQEEAFDVHGIELKVKEEPEKIEEEEDADVLANDEVDAAFKLSDEKMEEIITAIVDQDEETFRKYNYFGDRVLDDKLEQTVYMGVDGDEFESDDPMEEKSENEKEENKEKIKQLSEKTFDNALDYIAFQNDFEAELDKDFQENIEEIDPEGDSEKSPRFYRTEDVLEYAKHKGLTDINLDEYEIKDNINDNKVLIKDGDYDFGGINVALEKESDDETTDDEFHIHLHFNKYKDGFYYINGVEI